LRSPQLWTWGGGEAAAGRQLENPYFSSIVESDFLIRKSPFLPLCLAARCLSSVALKSPGILFAYSKKVLQVNNPPEVQAQKAFLNEVLIYSLLGVASRLLRAYLFPALR